jgi:predicted kinase
MEERESGTALGREKGCAQIVATAPGFDNGRMLLVLSGLPGTGKSAVATEVARIAGAVHLSIDAIEDALVGAGLERSWTTGVAAYEAVRAAAEQNLVLGRSVVVDAVNDREVARETWRRAASATGAGLTFVLLTLDDLVEHRQRLEGRHRDLANIDEPTWSEVRRRATAFEPWAGAHERMDAHAPVDELAESVAKFLTQN